MTLIRTWIWNGLEWRENSLCPQKSQTHGRFSATAHWKDGYASNRLDFKKTTIAGRKRLREDAVAIASVADNDQCHLCHLFMLILCLPPSHKTFSSHFTRSYSVIIGGGSWGLRLSTFVLVHPFTNVLLNTPCVLGSRLRVKHHDTTTA